MVTNKLHKEGQRFLNLLRDKVDCLSFPGSLEPAGALCSTTLSRRAQLTTQGNNEATNLAIPGRCKKRFLKCNRRHKRRCCFPLNFVHTPADLSPAKAYIITQVQSSKSFSNKLLEEQGFSLEVNILATHMSAWVQFQVLAPN